MDIFDFKYVNKSVLKKDKWTGSINEKFFRLSPKKKGNVGEQAIHSLLEEVGATVEKRTNSSHDFIVNGLIAEVKTSSIWSSGQLVFQEIRTHQDHDILLFVSVFPDDVKFHWCFKKDLAKYLKYQHSDTCMKLEVTNFDKNGFHEVMRELNKETIEIWEKSKD